MNKKKGFTLIELLAVIVILAVIALIATPLIMNTINDAKDSAMQRSVGNIQHAVEQHLMSKKVLDTNYTFTMSDFDYKGEKYDKMNIGFNTKDEAGVAVYKDNKCYYVLPGSSDVVIEENLDAETCLFKVGIDGEYVITSGKLIDAILEQRGTSATTTEGFIDNGDGTYAYIGAKGTGGTNWLWYGGHLWRIMTADTNNSNVELIVSYPVTSISWGSYDSVTDNCVVSGVCGSLETSYVGKWLNDVFLTSLSTDIKNSLVPMTYTRKIYKESNVTPEEVSNVKVRLLTEKEYNDYSGADGYLYIDDEDWRADVVSAGRVSSADYENSMTDSAVSNVNGIRPVITLSDVSFIGGIGTLTNPYIVSTSNAVKTSDILVGEYVSIPKSDGSTHLVRVVKQDGSGTKVILNGVFDGSSFSSSNSEGYFSKSLPIYTGALTNFKNTLDTTYFDNSNKTYNITQYNIGADYSLNTKTVQSDIGLPTIGEMFSGNDIDFSESEAKTFVDSSKVLEFTEDDFFWSMNSYGTSYVSIRTIYISGGVGYTSPNVATGGVRPTWYIKDVAITGGSGTANDPYTLK